MNFDQSRVLRIRAFTMQTKQGCKVRFTFLLSHFTHLCTVIYPTNKERKVKNFLLVRFLVFDSLATFSLYNP